MSDPQTCLPLISGSRDSPAKTSLKPANGVGLRASGACSSSDSLSSPQNYIRHGSSWKTWQGSFPFAEDGTSDGSSLRWMTSGTWGRGACSTRASSEYPSDGGVSSSLPDVLGTDGPDPEQILFESESLRGDSPAGGTTGEDVAGPLGGRTARGGWNDDFDRAGAFVATTTGRGWWREGFGTLRADDGGMERGSHLIVPCLTQRYGKGPDSDASDAMVAAPLTAGGHPQSHAPGRHREDDVNLIAAPVTASAGHHGHGSGRGDGSENIVADTVNTREGRSYLHGGKRARDMRTHNLIAAPLTAGGHPQSNAPGRRREDDENLIADTVRSHPRPGSNSLGNVIAAPITASAGHHGRSSGRGDGTDNLVADPISANEGNTYSHAGNNAGRLHNVVCLHADASRDGAARTPSPDAEGRVRLRDAGLGVADDGTSYSLSAGAPHAVFLHVNKGRPAGRKSAPEPMVTVKDHVPTLPTDGHAQSAVVAFSTKESGKDATQGFTPTLRAESGDPHMGGRMAVAVFDAAQITSPDNRTRVEPGMPSPAAAAAGRLHLADAAAVRRLTPLECERLQGLPDDWTALPGLADGARYRLIGNGVAVPVVEWIARRCVVARVGS